MAEVVLTALADQNVIKVSETDRAVVLKLIPLIPFLGKKVTNFNVFQFIVGLNEDVVYFLQPLLLLFI